MDPMTVAALISAVPQVVKLGTSLYQSGQAKKLEGNTVRPEYEIPESAINALNLAKSRLGQGLPGESLISEGIEGTTARGASDITRVASSPVDALGAISNLYGAEQTQQRELGIASAKQKSINEQLLESALNKFSSLEQEKFKFDEIDPYMQAMASISALKGASMQNLYSGAKGVSDVGAAYLSGFNSNGLDSPGVKSIGDELNIMNGGMSPDMPVDTSATDALMLELQTPNYFG